VKPRWWASVSDPAVGVRFVSLRASTWFDARRRASIALGLRYGHEVCAPERITVTGAAP
jgi:hypothetical protein